MDGIGGVLLDAAGAAQGRLADPADEEALHDFRVALRRLRSIERAFRGQLDDPMAKKLRRRVRDLARATNGARDAEVQLAWVRGRRKGLDREQRVGFTWFVKRLEAQRDREYEASIRAIDAEFPGVDRRVRKWLRGGRAADVPEGATFAAALGELIEEHLEALDGKLDAIHVPEDETAVHQARIAAKRLRYLLELIAAEIGAAEEAVTRLKSLQDVLGELHDRQVLDHEFSVAVEVAAADHVRRLRELEVKQASKKKVEAAERRNATPGVLTLARAGREVQRELFRTFTAEWRDGGHAAFKNVLEAVLDVLRAYRAGVPVEVERKYLLSGLPKKVRDAPSVTVEQGWLPGERLQERLRHVSGDDGDQYYRTVKLGQGLTRVELEEEASPELFEKLWALTEGRRLRKQRYYVPDGDLRWEVDEFLDRELVLAEVELADPALTVNPPTWLESLIVREVTGEPQYLNVNLGR
jgi:CHAD domain-containing protein/CYTH domain-containing protein